MQTQLKVIAEKIEVLPKDGNGDGREPSVADKHPTPAP
jgi:hypothetical protein